MGGRPVSAACPACGGRSRGWCAITAPRGVAAAARSFRIARVDERLLGPGAALWSIGAQYIAFAIQFVVSVLISRFFLSPAEMGLFSIALSAAMMVSALQDFGIRRFVAGERDLSEAQVRTCFFRLGHLCAGIGFVILALAWPVARFYANDRLTPLLVIIASSYLIVPFGIVPSAMLQRRMDYRSLFLVNVGAAVVNAVLSLGLAWAGYSAFALPGRRWRSRRRAR